MTCIRFWPANGARLDCGESSAGDAVHVILSPFETIASAAEGSSGKEQLGQKISKTIFVQHGMYTRAHCPRLCALPPGSGRIVVNV